MRIEMVANELVIRVVDNGRGFEMPKATASQSGNGLENIKLRLKQLGGSADFQSAAGKGTTVTLRMPLK